MGAEISLCTSATPQTSPLRIDTNCPLSIPPFSPENSSEIHRAACQSPVGSVSLESLRLDTPDALDGEHITTMLTPRLHRSDSAVSVVSAGGEDQSLHRRCDTEDHTDTSSLASSDHDAGALTHRLCLHRRSMSSGLDLLGLIRSGDVSGIAALMGHLNISMVRWKHDLCAVHVAAMFGQVEVLDLLHASGCDLSAKDEFRRTALHWAALHHQDEALEYITLHVLPHVQRGIDIFGYTAEEYKMQDGTITEDEDMTPHSGDERMLQEEDSSVDVSSITELMAVPSSSPASSSQSTKSTSMKKRMWKKVKSILAAHGPSGLVV